MRRTETAVPVTGVRVRPSLVPPRFGEQSATVRLAAGLSGFLHHYRKIGGDMINGKDILALGWPAGKVIGLGLETASLWNPAASTGTKYSLNWRTSGRIPA